MTFAGRTYYPAGARMHFIPSEMVLSGEFRGVPLYSRTTIEPYSLVFVPVAGGLFQPYERRRDGDLAGTVGSSAPSFPVTLASEEALAGESPSVPQAAAPPMRGGLLSAGDFAAVPRPVGTTGTTAMVAPPMTDAAPRTPPRPVAARRVPRRPDALNGIFISYAGGRWFSSGPSVLFDASRFEVTGSRQGFPVYRDRTATDATIYVPVTEGADGLVAPYSTRR